MEFLGPSGRVPEEFLDFGPVAAGQGVHLRCLVTVERPVASCLAVGASATKRAWLDGRPVALDGAGYLADRRGRFACAPGRHRPAADRDGGRRRAPSPLRFVDGVEGYAQPQWLRPAAETAKSSVVAFIKRFSLPADPVSADVLVGANGPCRVLVDGREVGRQGGFDPYAEWDRDRLQPYDLREALRAGERAAPARAALAGPLSPVPRRCSTHVYPHGRRRPRGALGRRLERLGRRRRDRARLPPRPAWRPGLQPRTAATAPTAGGRLARAGARDGGRGRDGDGRSRHGHPAAASHHAARCHRDLHPARVRLPRRGDRGRPPGRGAAGCGGRAARRAGRRLAGARPVRDRGRAGTGPRRRGRAHRADRLHRRAEGAWSWSTGRTPASSTTAGECGIAGELDLGLPDDVELTLDLGAVRGTAEVLINSKSAGVRRLFALLGSTSADGWAVMLVTLEVLVLNALGPHLDAVSPTPYVFPGQRASGLLGPVHLSSPARDTGAEWFTGCNDAPSSASPSRASWARWLVRR